MENEENIVISLGGSILIPENPDSDFVISFKNIILNWIAKGKKFFIVVGGGKVCRIYQDALSKTINADKEVLDWMGIYSTHLNANFLRLSFEGNAYKEIITDPSFISDINDPIIIGAGWKPGCSTDTDAVMIAKQINSNKIINLSSVPFVYDSDPKVNPNAKKFENISWDEYISLIGEDWIPGMNLPFDPIASRLAKESKIELVFIGGKNLESLDSYLSGSSFMGTIIK